MMKRLNVDVPLGWSQLLIRFVTILVIGMILLNIKEYRDAGVFDVPATLVDADVDRCRRGRSQRDPDVGDAPSTAGATAVAAISMRRREHRAKPNSATMLVDTHSSGTVLFSARLRRMS